MAMKIPSAKPENAERTFSHKMRASA